MPLAEDVRDDIYNAVMSQVEYAEVTDPDWTSAKIVSKICQYVYKAGGKDDLRDMDVEAGTRTMVDQFMGSYMSSCGERPWFYQVEIVPVLLIAGRTLAQPCEHWRVEDVVTTRTSYWIDKSLITKGIWKSVGKVFGEADSAMRDKISNHLTKTSENALVKAQEMKQEEKLSDAETLQRFTSRWVEDSLTRCWNTMSGDPKAALNEENCMKLFSLLIAPCGADMPLSCFPAELVDPVGRPDPEWPFAKQCIRNLFLDWDRMKEGGSKKKKRKAAAAIEDEGDWSSKIPTKAPAFPPLVRGPGANGPLPSELEVIQDPPPSPILDPPGNGEDQRRHPDCMQAEDCMGKAGEPLMQHLRKGVPEDVYCKTCWTYLSRQNPRLQGVEVSP